MTIVFSMSAWLLWPVALAPTPEIELRLQAIASGVGLYWGTSFTLILGAAYLPSALWLSSRVRELRAASKSQPGTGSPGQAGRPSLADFGLGRSVFSQVTQLAALMSPMITGVVPFLDWLT